MQTPSIGRVVVVRADPKTNNGADEAPALITRVFGSELPGGSWTVNVRVLLDAADVTPARTSISLYADQAAADEAKPAGVHCGWWPPRV